MRRLIVLTAIAAGGVVRGPAQEPPRPPEAGSADAVYKDLSAKLPKDGLRAASARLELEYWREHHELRLPSAVRKAVKTKDGKAAEVVLLSAPAPSMPGTDFSMAFLLVADKVVDWASCWSYNRTATQDLRLEDVDGDGAPDLAFRAGKGFWGLTDKRAVGRPGDDRRWLYAYAITAGGFRSLFPEADRELALKVATDPAGHPVRLEVEGLPERVRERRMVECTVSATNTSDKPIPVKPAEWLRLDAEKGGYLMTRAPADPRVVLKAGETVSQRVRLVLESDAKEITVRWTFAPAR